jgi:uncharacterized protein (UPF0548 family)
LKAGAHVCVTAKTLLLWSRNPLQVTTVTQCEYRHATADYSLPGILLQVVYADESRRKFSFAHGTLAGHMLAGEERFAVELASDGDVYYDIWALSKPGNMLARLAYPIARAQQKQFANDSTAAMLRIVRGSRAQRAQR